MYTTNRLTRSYFDALLIGSVFVAAVLLCMKRGDTLTPIRFSMMRLERRNRHRPHVAAVMCSSILGFLTMYLAQQQVHAFTSPPLSQIIITPNNMQPQSPSIANRHLSSPLYANSAMERGEMILASDNDRLLNAAFSSLDDRDKVSNK